MDIRHERIDGVEVLRPRGALVGGDADTFAERVRETVASSDGRLVVDLGAVPFTDRAGLEALADAAEELERRGRSLPLCNVSRACRSLVDLDEIGGRLACYVDKRSAVRSLVA